jgi:PBSX family phage terminase large subunit
MATKLNKWDNTLELNEFSEQGEKFLASELGRFSVLEGAIRTGKSYVAVTKTIQYLIENMDVDSNEKRLMVFGGSTQGTVQRNILGIFFGILNEYFKTVKYHYNEKWGKIEIGNFDIYILGYATIRTSSIILGSTIQYALLDEVNFCSIDDLNVILDRLSLPNSKMVCTLNPQGPNHVIYKDFIDNEDLNQDLKHYHYTLEKDAVNLDPEYVKSLYRRYPVGSVNYRTKILGLRGAELNSIYGEYVRSSTFISEIPELPIWAVGIDIGWSSTTAITLVNMSVDKKEIKKAVVAKEVNLSGKETDITIDKIKDEVLRLVKYVNVNYNTGVSVCIPHDGLSLFNELKKYTRKYVFKPYSIKPDTYDAIEQVRDLFHRRVLLINKQCQHTIDSIYSYAFKENANGEYVVDKLSNDHFCDSFRLTLIDEQTRKLFKERKTYNDTYQWNNGLKIEILKPNNMTWRNEI